MAQITCHDCGAKQPGDRKHCISCGCELYPKKPELPPVEPMKEFKHSRFTLIVTIITIASAIFHLGMLISILTSGKFYTPEFLAVSALVCALFSCYMCLFPEIAYVRSFSWLFRISHPERLDNLTLNQVRLIFIDAVGFTALSWIVMLIYFAAR